MLKAHSKYRAIHLSGRPKLFRRIKLRMPWLMMKSAFEKAKWLADRNEMGHFGKKFENLYLGCTEGDPKTSLHRDPEYQVFKW